LDLLVRRGDGMLAAGDISGARLFYRRAAEGGSAVAARALGKTFDPAFLSATGAVGIRPDPDAALTWYRRAAALGDEEASKRITAMTQAGE
jgi:TPR repeat protein